MNRNHRIDRVAHTFLLSLSVLVTMTLGQAWAALTSCKFNFGVGWNGPNATYPQQADYVTIWVGADANFNVWWEGEMLKACKSGGKLAGRTPVYYSYIIAETAKRELKVVDCNVGTPNLCQKGANFMRQSKPVIMAQYEKYASETAKIWGTQDPIIWLMEPDYYQYASDTKQEGGPLTFAEAGAFLEDMVAAVKKHLPNAVFSMDISPWVANPASWYGALKMSDFTYINTSGGNTDAENARIRAVNPMTWKSIHELTKKPIIADDGYGVAGSPTFHDATWDNVANLNARIADGVIAISQAGPKADWNSVITSTRSQLRAIPSCQGNSLAHLPGEDLMPGSPRLILEKSWRGRNALGRDLRKNNGLRLNLQER